MGAKRSQNTANKLSVVLAVLGFRVYFGGFWGISDSGRIPIRFVSFLELSKNLQNIGIVHLFFHVKMLQTYKKIWGHILKLLFLHISTSQKSKRFKCLKLPDTTNLKTIFRYVFEIWWSNINSLSQDFHKRHRILRCWNLDKF